MLKAFRIFRILRVSRVLKLLHHFKALYTIIQGFLGALRPLVWVAILLAVIIYSTSIILVQFVGHADEGTYAEFPSFDPKTYFGTMAKSCFTLVHVVLGFEFREFSRPIR